MKISKSIHYVGVNDHQIDLFEGLFNVPNGMSYNSYVIFDEKIAVMDSVGENFGEEWLDNIESAVGNRTPDYLIVQHMEMDHSANIQKFISKYPNAKIVASKMAFGMLNSLFGDSLGKISEKQIVVSDGDSLELGEHILHFVSAPNVHWPEVIFTYESSEKILFSADAFGKFGALDYEDPEGWACEARRYYFGIVGKFGTSVQAVLKKLEGLQIEKICSLHGPVLDSDIESYLQKYQIWSSYAVESEGVFIAYTSVYGNTKKAVEKLAEILKEKGCAKVVVADLAREDIYECVEDAFRYGKLVLATTTYNAGVFPTMREFIEHLVARNYQKRKIAFVENGTWAPTANKAMERLFENSQEITFVKSKVSIKVAMTAANVEQMHALADELLA